MSPTIHIPKYRSKKDSAQLNGNNKRQLQSNDDDYSDPTLTKRKRTSPPANTLPSNQSHSNLVSPTFNGFVNTTQDALLVFEACRTGMRKRVVRRLSDSERAIFIASKAVFAWDEAESGIKRWTDGRHWSPSRINGSFLIYREVEPCAPLAGANGRQSSRNAAAPEFVVKENGLIKKAISVTTSDGRKQHLVSYYNREDLDASRPVDCPSTSPDFSHLVLSASVYPEFVQEVQALMKESDPIQRVHSHQISRVAHVPQPNHFDRQSPKPTYQQEQPHSRSPTDYIPALHPHRQSRSPVHQYQQPNYQHPHPISPEYSGYYPKRSPDHGHSCTSQCSHHHPKPHSSYTASHSPQYSHSYPPESHPYPSPYSDTTAPPTMSQHPCCDGGDPHGRSSYHNQHASQCCNERPIWEAPRPRSTYEGVRNDPSLHSRSQPPPTQAGQSLPPLSALLRAAGVAAK